MRPVGAQPFWRKAWTVDPKPHAALGHVGSTDVSMNVNPTRERLSVSSQFQRPEKNTVIGAPEPARARSAFLARHGAARRQARTGRE